MPCLLELQLEIKSALYSCAQRKWGDRVRQEAYLVTGPVPGMLGQVPRELSLPCLEEQFAAFPNMRISAT